MIQLNLLPDVKLEYLKAQRMRRMATVISFIVTATAVAILVILLSVEGFQKHTLSNLNKDVANKTSTLQGEPQINSVLTVQNQLQSINGLHASEPAANRLFDYLNELTPTTVTISGLNVDFNAHTISITGDTNSLASVNQYIDTLKFTSYTTGHNTKNAAPFNTIVLSAFALDTAQQNGTTNTPASYTITANFDPTIFDVTKNVTLVIPSTVTTRSDREHPGELFVNGLSSTTSSGGSQ
jgi:Tfp pilus assembly protein PilN